MEQRFNEAKATQIAALLLTLRGTHRMKYLKLLKLMYIVDREALTRWGRPVTTDHYVSMDKGPVLSRVYSLISEEPCEPTFWTKHIELVQDHDVQLTVDPGDDELSCAEGDLIREVFAEHGHKSRWQLVRELHQCPEWQNPQGSIIPIAISDILRAVGKTPGDIVAITQDLEAEAFAEFLLRPAH